MRGELPGAALVAALSAALAAACAVGPTAHARLSRVGLTWRPRRSRTGSSPATSLSAVPPRALACAVCGLGVALLVEGGTGLLAGAAAAAAGWTVIGRLEPAAQRRRREALSAALPLGVDLLAACLSAGRPPADSVRVVAQAVHDPLDEELAVLAARLTLGADPVGVWRGIDDAHPLAPLARVMARSLETGAPASEGLTRLADDLRREQRSAVDKAARSVGVRATAPLGLCFLPAFVLIGIVPAVVSVFASLELW